LGLWVLEKGCLLAWDARSVTPTPVVDQLIAGRRSERVLDPGVQVGERLEHGGTGQVWYGERLDLHRASDHASFIAHYNWL
jgi:hypothetical protein